MPLRVLLADDHRLVRGSLRALLEKEGFAIAGEASNGHEAVRLAAETAPDVAILDVVMPIVNGVDAAREIRRLSPRTTVVLLTMHDEPRGALDALEAGAKGYDLKTTTAEELIHAIRDAADGGVHLGVMASGRLSPRERQVVRLVAEGKTNKEIATLLDISVKTADSHRARALRKLGLQGTAALVRYAVRAGLVEP